ncbi:MAG: hypothetical protein ACI91T_003012 [Natronomonas sp.]|jgi:hypothetical protein
MSWTHSSKGVVLAVLLAVSLLSVGTAAAISISGDAPTETQVGEQVSMNITIEEPFGEQPNQWTLGGSTELQNATWTVNRLSQGRPVEQGVQQYSGQSFNQDLNFENGATTIEITVEGTVPPFTSEAYSYEQPSAENFGIATISSVVDGTNNELESWTAHRYTEDTRSARNTIDEAAAAVANTSSAEAIETLNTSISLYDDGNFDQAENLANEARSTAQQASGGLPLIPIIGVVLVLVVVVGGVFYYRSQQQSSGHKLQ